MTLGCGSWGGNVTSDNISPRHLVDIKRIAFETRPINQPAATDRPAQRAAATVDRSEIAALVDRFLAERHVHQPGQQAVPHQPQPATAPALNQPSQAESQPFAPSANGATNGRIYDFVCEEDVKRAIASREKIYVNNKTIITPAARELGEEREVFARP
jgi:acetaldehyde dehydrogenase (acetylating)